ncbi:hypothetical protein KBY83_12675 [Cyanobium sp. WKJ7-Wakatipu]|uniref:hypothetical protein n=1 Tax=Cyanobium sp. WKJ7-Wakatipu TaxID=2823726 RepID=UPI0020CF789A|nr:hypothetical protein [Cyanobium sp. WKJ7-Wakatipu]MCP9784155.1 hypothetical protein [Cyanobium sp. WKJ7-Wakatipu]
MALSLSALEARVRRRLACNNERLCIPRSQGDWNDLGIHVVDANNVVIASGCTIEGLATELEVAE